MSIRIADFELLEPDGKHVMLVNRNALDTIIAAVNILPQGVQAIVNKFSTGGEILSYNGNIVQVKIHTGDAMLLQLMDNAMGVENGVDPQSVTISPNPARSHIRINHNDPPGAKARIFSLDGKLLMEKQLKSQGSQIDIAHLPKGVYFFTFEGASGLQYLKLVKY